MIQFMILLPIIFEKCLGFDSLNEPNTNNFLEKSENAFSSIVNEYNDLKYFQIKKDYFKVNPNVSKQ